MIDYKWHDIRENEADLPTEKCRVLKVSRSMSGIQQYDAAWFSPNLYEVDNYDFAELKGVAGFYSYDSDYGYYIVRVDAWKHIEPFEN